MTCVQSASTEGPCPQNTFNTDNQLTNPGLTYDADGNLTNDGTHTYQYDAEGRVISVDNGATQASVYNALGERVQDQLPGSRTVTYPRDLAGHMVGVYEAGNWDVKFTRIAGQRVAMGSSSFVRHSDLVGSTTMVTDPSGVVAWDETFYPSGLSWQQTGTNAWPIYGNMDLPMNDGNYPAKVRSYNPIWGRWTTPDPGGRKVVNLDNPQTWNMYAYVGDNPTTLNDPSGMAAKGCGKESHNVCPKQPLNGLLKAGRQDQLQRALQAYYHAQRVKQQQFAQKQAGPAIGSKEYIKQLANKTAALTSSGEKEILLPVAIEQGVVLAVVAAPEAGAVVGPTATAVYGYTLTHPLETRDFGKGVLTGAGIGAIASRANAIGDAINALIKYLQR